MKVIQKPPDFDWSRVVDCLFCRARLEIVLVDVAIRYGVGDDSQNYYRWLCPYCGIYNHISDLPDGVKVLAGKTPPKLPNVADSAYDPRKAVSPRYGYEP